MKLEHLRYIVKAAELASVSTAAKKMFMTQPHLSKIIRDMEREVNYSIFVRRSGGISLTKKGTQFITYAKRIIKEADGLLSLSNGSACRFSISSVRTPLVFGCFLQLVQEQPGDQAMRFSICENGNNKTIDDVYSQNSDLGVIYIHKSGRRETLNMLASKHISYHKICQLRQTIILSSDHPLLKIDRQLTKDDLYAYGMLKYRNGMVFGDEYTDSLWYNTIADLDKFSRIIEVCEPATIYNLLVSTNFFAVSLGCASPLENLPKIVSVPFPSSTETDDSAAEMGYIHLHSMPYSDLCSRFIQLLCNAYGVGADSSKNK